MAKVKLTRSQMAFASGETLEQFNKRTGGKDPTEGVKLPGGNAFFEGDDDTLVDDEEYGVGSGSDDDIPPGEEVREYIDEDDGDAEDDSKPSASNGKKVKVPDWADDEAVEFAASYGLADADLANFESVDDLYEYGRKADKALATGKDATGKDGDAKGAKSEPAKKPKGSNVLEKLKPLDRQRYVDAKYGEEELSLVDGLNATIEILRGDVELRQQEADRKQAEEFNKALDDIDPKLFGRAVVDGKIGNLSDAYRNNRLKVHETVERLANSIAEEQERQGKEVKIPSIPVLAKRAVGMLFGELNQPGGRPNADAVAERSRARRPTSSVGRRGASSGTSGKSDTATVDPKAIARHPALQRYWKQTQRENGAE
jgi:hypothetical protein